MGFLIVFGIVFVIVITFIIYKLRNSDMRNNFDEKHEDTYTPYTPYKPFTNQDLYGGFGGGTTETTVSKNCEHCGGSVSLTAEVGDKCPHCGVTWGAQHKRRIN